MTYPMKLGTYSTSLGNISDYINIRLKDDPYSSPDFPAFKASFGALPMDHAFR